MNKDKEWRERFKEHWDKRFGDSVLMWKWRDELIEIVDQALQDKEREVREEMVREIEIRRAIYPEQNDRDTIDDIIKLFKRSDDNN